MLKFGRVNSIFILLVPVIFILNLPSYLYLLLVVGWLVLTSIGSFHIRWNYFLKAFHANPSIKKKSVAITFDDGPYPVITLKIVELLRQYNAKATFFCVGKQIEENPEIFMQVVQAGHTIGNHSYSHSNNFGFFSTKRVLEELKKTDDLIFSLITKKVRLFRPPFGVTNPNIAKAIKQNQYDVIGWNVRSLDTKIQEPKKIVERVTKKLKAGDIILLHDTNERTVLVLEQLLLFLQKNEFKTSTVEQLFELEAFH